MTTLCIFGASSLAIALPGDNNGAPAYVDSVYEWGAWELGVEPAAGGSATISSNALRLRQPDIKFRPNDNNAFSPDVVPVTPKPSMRTVTRVSPAAGAKPPAAKSPADLY